MELAELLAVAVVVQDGEPRLRGAQRQLLALERQPRGELPVLELVLALDELGRDDPALADLPQAVQLLALVALGARSASHSASSCSRVKRSAIPADDLGLLGDLLLPDADRAALLGALEEVLPEPLLVLEQAYRRRRQSRPGIYLAIAPTTSRPNGLAQRVEVERLRQGRRRRAPGADRRSAPSR